LLVAFDAKPGTGATSKSICGCGKRISIAGCPF
jgi:hypothetical protein